MTVTNACAAGVHALARRMAAIGGVLAALVVTPAPAAPALPDVRSYPELNDLQLGHLRFILNLASQKDNDWSRMDSDEPGQGGFDAYRYQLAMMSYALNLANYRYTPAYRELYQAGSERLIAKMLRPDVWNFWEMTSRGVKQFDPDLVKLSEGWRDPVIRQNVMYSGHLFQMVNTYAMLYDSDKYEQPASLKFVYDPVGRGLGKEEFDYDAVKLAKVLRDQFLDSGWSGIECEPNAVFPECNQHPILGFKLFDLRHGTAYFEEVSRNYRQAFDAQNFLDPVTGSFMAYKLVKQGKVIQAELPWSDGWSGVFMHGWAKQEVEGTYPALKKKYLAMQEDGSAVVAARKPTPFFSWNNGFFAVLAAEMGDVRTSTAMLAYADKHWNPTWVDGGLYYPRHGSDATPAEDSVAGERPGRFVSRRVNVLTGNALLALARMDAKDGFYTLFNQPWGADHFKQPYLTGVDYPTAYVTRAVFDGARQALIATIKPSARPAFKAATTFSVANLPVDTPLAVVVNGIALGPLTAARPAAAKRGISAVRRASRLTVTAPFGKPLDIIVQSSAQ